MLVRISRNLKTEVMKKAILIVALIGGIITGNFAVAQEGHRVCNKEREHKSPEERAKIKTDRMKKDLSLTEDQTKQIEALNLEHFKEMEGIHIQLKALKDKACEMREAHKAEINGLLTPEQQRLAKEKMEERHQKRQERKRTDKTVPMPVE